MSTSSANSNDTSGLTASPGTPASGWSNRFLPAVALAFCVILTYAPVFAITYAFSDDYCFLQEASKQKAGIWAENASRGRPVYAGLVVLYFGHARTVADLCWVRASGVVCLAALAVMVYVAFRRARFSAALSAAFAFIVSTMPAFQVDSAWATDTGHIVASVMAAACALLLLKSDVPDRSVGKIWRLALACLVLVVAMLTYQPCAMFVWFFVALAAATSKEDPGVLIKRLVPITLVAVLCCAVGYVAYKIGVSGYRAPSEAQNVVTKHPVGKVTWFLTEPLMNALNLNWIEPRAWRAVLSGALIIAGLPLFIEGSLRKKLVVLGILILLVPLSYLPNLMGQASQACYRTQVALTTLVALYLFLALHGLVNKLITGSAGMRGCAMGIIVFVWALLSGLLASHNVVSYFVEPQSVEYRLVKDQLSKLGPNPQTIWYIRSHTDDGLTLVRYDEFGTPSSSTPWVADGMVNCALRELGRASDDAVKVTQVDPDAAGQLPANAAVVDMRLLKRFR